jgi:Ca2+/Na+ antiporter
LVAKARQLIFLKGATCKKNRWRMREWALFGGLAALITVASLFAMTQVGMVRGAGQVVLTIELGVLLVGAALFGYICLRAQAKKWGAGLIVVAVLCALLIYVVWAGRLPFF